VQEIDRQIQVQGKALNVFLYFHDSLSSLIIFLLIQKHLTKSKEGDENRVHNVESSHFTQQ
jgi:hypothetical protein